MFDIIDKFEKTVAEYYGAPYGVSVDCCTHAIELCLRLRQVKSTLCPKHTYVSIPQTLIKLGIKFKWDDVEWKDYYELGNTGIIDAAVLWKKGSYVSGSLMCLSFQFKKHLNLGRGGMILLDNFEDYQHLQKLSFDGRQRNLPWKEQNIENIGYHYYMTPETAELGLLRFNQVKDLPPVSQSFKDYPNLSEMGIFKLHE